MVKGFNGYVITKKLFDAGFILEEDLRIIIGNENLLIAELQPTSIKKIQEGFVNVRYIHDSKIEQVPVQELKVLALTNESRNTSTIHNKAIDVSYPLPIADSQWNDLIVNGRYDDDEIMEYGVIYKTTNPYETNIRLHKHIPIAKLIIKSLGRNTSWDKVFNKIKSVLGEPKENETPLDYLERTKESLKFYYFNPKNKQ